MEKKSIQTKNKLNEESVSNGKCKDNDPKCLSIVSIDCTVKNSKQDEDSNKEKGDNLQLATEVVSLIIMFIGFSLAVIAPWFLLAIFTFPGPYSPYFKTAIWICCILSLIFIVFGSCMGNIVWYYDTTRAKWRFIVHCGSNKIRHHWGDSFFKHKRKNDIIVEYL